MADDAKRAHNYLTQAQAAERMSLTGRTISGRIESQWPSFVETTDRRSTSRVTVLGQGFRRGTSFRAVERAIIEHLDPKLRTLSRNMREQVMMDRLSEYGGCDS